MKDKEGFSEDKTKKYLVYLPKDLCEDSKFPFKDSLKASAKSEKILTVPVKVSFNVNDPTPKLLIEPVEEVE